MANPEACEVYIDQEIEEGHVNGEADEIIGRRVSAELLKLFEAKIKARTIARRSRRQRVTSVTTPPTPSNNTEKEGAKGAKEDKKKVICIECHHRVAKRKKKKGKWYYYPGNLCTLCRTIDDYKKVEEANAEGREKEKIYPTRSAKAISSFIIAHLEDVPRDNDEWRVEFEIIVEWINKRLKKE